MFDSKLKKELAAERERALKSEALDHAMHDHLPMIEFTTDGYILDASPLFLHSVGYSLNEIVQQHHAMFCMYRSSYHLTPASNRCLVYATLVRTSFGINFRPFLNML
ncbi:hypothetical protein WP8S18E04_25380 [Aeromonas caviae]|nr:hypothetical protein WP8S18E04_25380 [Aeromonas caviae]